jgi:hypothetical protein
MPNFALLDTGQPEIAYLLTAMLQARRGGWATIVVTSAGAGRGLVGRRPS